MCSTPVDIPGVARAQWLAEVAEELARAEKLMMRLNLGGRYAPVAAELQLRIEAAMGEAKSLRTGQSWQTGCTTTDQFCSEG